MRMRGHAIHDPANYVPKQLLEEWETLDPIKITTDTLRNQGVLDHTTEADIALKVKTEVDAGLKWADSSPLPNPDTLTAGIYA